MKFRWHVYPAPRLFFFQFTPCRNNGVLEWIFRIGHRQLDVVFV